jgi:hypothetical protein
MKKTLFASALLLGGGLAYAQTGTTGTTSDTRSADTSRRQSTHKLTAEVVSADSSARTITVRNLAMGSGHAGSSATTPGPGTTGGPGTSGTDTGTMGSGTGTTGTGTDTGSAMGSATLTLKVEGKAANDLKKISAGDTVELTCRMAGMSGTSGTTGTGTTGTGTSETGTTGTTGTTGSDSGMASGTITSQAMADTHCSAVTAIKKARNDRSGSSTSGS